jgi:YggT family protein
MLLYTLYQIIGLLLDVLQWIIVIQAILSWLVVFNVINTHSPFVRSVFVALEKMTEPLYRPFRRILPDFGGLDFSPLIVLLIIYIMRQYVLPNAMNAAGIAV